MLKPLKLHNKGEQKAELNEKKVKKYKKAKGSTIGH